MAKKFTVCELRGTALYLRARAAGMGLKPEKPKRRAKREQLLRHARNIEWAADRIEILEKKK